MPLPVTKGELNRLGQRLIEGQEPSEADLVELAPVLAYYQEVLERVKAHLRDLGFAPTGRIKTITTMLDKLRRTHGMELSRMQDIAGARIAVLDIAAQDQAKETITEFYAERICECREVDRRKDPRFGYRAVHLIVRTDGIPVEIQIRTDLQDTWAQIVERLADRWGRGIRYGEDPERPDSLVRSEQFVVTRRDAMRTLMSLGDAIATTEGLRHSVDRFQSTQRDLDLLLQSPQRSQLELAALAQKITAVPLKGGPRLKEFLAEYSDDLDDELSGLLAAGADISVAQLLQLSDGLSAVTARRLDGMSAELRVDEQRLRDTLRLIAEATDEEGGQ